MSERVVAWVSHFVVGATDTEKQGSYNLDIPWEGARCQQWNGLPPNAIPDD